MRAEKKTPDKKSSHIGVIPSVVRKPRKKSIKPVLICPPAHHMDALSSQSKDRDEIHTCDLASNAMIPAAVSRDISLKANKKIIEAEGRVRDMIDESKNHIVDSMTIFADNLKPKRKSMARPIKLNGMSDIVSAMLDSHLGSRTGLRSFSERFLRVNPHGFDNHRRLMFTGSYSPDRDNRRQVADDYD